MPWPAHPSDAPSPRLLLFTGAPPASSLDAASCTVTGFEAAFQELFGIASDAPAPSASPSAPAWRSLPLVRGPLPLAQAHHLADLSLLSGRHHAFFTTADVHPFSSLPGEDPEALLTQFCHQSLAHHRPLSQSDSLLDSFDSDETDFDSTLSLSHGPHPLDSASGSFPLPTPPAAKATLSSLEAVPSARHLVSLHPQTLTLHLVVGVISIAQPRTVLTRWGTSLSLVELLVGDETAAPFSITFWLSQDRVAESAVTTLRRQDVILIENLALNVFRGKVYGQTLRKGLTRLHLLWRPAGGGFYSTLALAKASEAQHPHLPKLRLVKNWLLDFVGPDPRARASDSRTTVWDMPPAHSQ